MFHCETKPLLFFIILKQYLIIYIILYYNGNTGNTGNNGNTGNTGNNDKILAQKIFGGVCPLVVLPVLPSADGKTDGKTDGNTDSAVGSGFSFYYR